MAMFSSVIEDLENVGMGTFFLVLIICCNRLYHDSTSWYQHPCNILEGDLKCREKNLDDHIYFQTIT
jgi:hypothetical protein